MLQGGACVDHRFDPIAHDDDHVAVLDDLVLIGHVAVAGDDVRAAFPLVPPTTRMLDRSRRLVHHVRCSSALSSCPECDAEEIEMIRRTVSATTMLLLAAIALAWG